jgi:hypothetical protein
MKYYQGQTLQIDLVIHVDITGAGTVQIKYRKPSGATGAWTATVVDAEDGWLRYTLASASNDESGVWFVWPYIVQADASVVKGTAQQIRMNVEGT